MSQARGNAAVVPCRAAVTGSWRSPGDPLDDPARPTCYLEVKNVHLMREPRLAEFPDCVTDRGAKHMRELAQMRAGGARAVLLFVLKQPNSNVVEVVDSVKALVTARGEVTSLTDTAWKT